MTYREFDPPTVASPPPPPAPPSEDEPVVNDATFMRNARDGLANGYELLCAWCGVGVQDDSDIHEIDCPHYDRERAR